MYRPYEQKDRSFKWHLNNFVFGLYTLLFKRLGSVRFFHFVFFQYFYQRFITVRKNDEDVEDLDEDVYCSIAVTK